MPEDAPLSPLSPSLPPSQLHFADPLCAAAAQRERGVGTDSYIKISPGNCVIFVSAQLTPTQKSTEKCGNP